MYKEKLQKQIEELESLQSERNAVEVSREILRLANELDRLNDEPKEITFNVKIDGKVLCKSFKS